ncbi:MAG: nitrous oxide reductase family maturation protein NosD [Bacteroidetes bacterium]|jgi:nitrous oxidase accessory protein|nr:MAG: nitrous oxide reductase family maturation protein NosD [Bacteroidota bacterium]UCE68737.1 MAG: nitrous oxide reductase family maturation protein NosD [Flavobacteriaceae bacterium]
MNLQNRHSFYLLLLLLLGVPRVWAGTIPVCGNCHARTIQQGIALAEDRDTLLIRDAVYKEYNLIIDKPLTLLGENYPVVDGQEKGEIFRIVSDHVQIQGLRIINVGVSYTSDHAAIRVVRSSNFHIEDNRFENLFFGIFLEKSSHGIVRGNQITGVARDEYNSGNGVHLWYSNNVAVTDNRIEGVRDGIYLEFSDTIRIRGNESRKNLRYGLHFMFSNDNVYTDNLFENNGAGVAVMFSKRIRMTGNRFLKNWGPASYGMLLKEINDAEISGNLFEQNTVGINIEGSNRITYIENDFVSNGWAVRVMGACYSNSFNRNNFLYNSFDLSYNSNVNDNSFEGNYWSSYSGYDLDKNGVGDIPHRPVKLFSYIVNRTPETLILLRSLFMDLIDFSERVSPVFTPDNLADPRPQIRAIK